MAGEQQEYHIRFDELNPAQANIAAIELQGMLRDNIGSGIDVDILKEDTETMDGGCALLLQLLEPAAVTALVTAIAAFITKYGNHVVIETTEGKIVARGKAAKNIDVAATIAAMKSDSD